MVIYLRGGPLDGWRQMIQCPPSVELIARPLRVFDPISLQEISERRRLQTGRDYLVYRLERNGDDWGYVYAGFRSRMTIRADDAREMIRGLTTVAVAFLIFTVVLITTLCFLANLRSRSSAPARQVNWRWDLSASNPSEPGH